MRENLITCLTVGRKYDDVYVHKLKSMVERYTTKQFDFVCYSDHHIDGIDTVIIDDPLQFDPLWYKLQMLYHPQINQHNHKVFFDLDVVIHGNIDWVFDVHPKSLAVLKSAWKKQSEIDSHLNTGCNSSVMIWEHDAYRIFDKFMTAPDTFMLKYKGIDRFMWHENVEWEYISTNQVYSYRGGASREDYVPFVMRSDRSICIYNQTPKPHEVADQEPARSHWL